MAVENGLVDDEAIEPLGGIAPLSASLQAFADFFAISSDLVEAAIGDGSAAPSANTEREATETFIRSLPEEDKVALLMRLQDGEPHLGAELRRQQMAAMGQGLDTGGGQCSAGALREAARRIAAEHQRAAIEEAAAKNHRREKERAQARKQHLALLAERGEAPWRKVEELISRRNQPGYERAVTLIIDLGEVARSRGKEGAFTHRLSDIRTRHDRTGRLIERLDEAGLR